MITDVPPKRMTVMLKRSGAAWYRGAGVRYTESLPRPYSLVATIINVLLASIASSSSSVLTPLGRPVVPDV